MIECSFEEKVDLPGGGFRHATCVNKAEILVIGDPCFGLCYHCAYKKLKAENEQLKKWQIKPTEAICLVDIKKCSKMIKQATGE
jgi:hypothetical protein